LHPTENATLIFHGAMTYFANYDGIEYFLRSIFPLIRAQKPDVTLSITGSTEGVDLNPLALDDRVKFTGYVDDIRQVLGRSQVCVVPLRKGAGTRLKILEAMAMGIPVVSTSKGAEGLELVSGVHALIADDPAEFASKTLELLRDPGLRDTLNQNAYQMVTTKYAWSGIEEGFEAMTRTLAPRVFNGV
jgi:glycosyltransferase involved in cell wall biosynthesis